MSLDRLNSATIAQARHSFMQCCTANAWVNAMVSARPYRDKNSLTEQANSVWQTLDEVDYLQAFEGHPQIGNLDTLRTKYANTKALASGEQSAVKQASERVLLGLARDNAAYLEKFGFIFIVCASGKSAEQMLALLQTRLANDKNTELANAAEEQRKILQLRLEKLL
jgi:2-oxo-4-hydroxy-4-carboxy-5-ureidoimidazoline decarboxylase